LRSAQRLSVVDYGYRPEGLIAMAMDLPRARYDSTRKHVELYESVIERVRRLPGVTGVAGTSEGIGHTGATTFSFAIEGRQSRNASGREDPQALRVVTPDYFRVLGIPVKQGRAFDVRDRADAAPVVIVNQSLARALWPTTNPVGSRISFVGQSGPWLEVVGVVGDSRSNAADEDAAPALFMPHAQKRWNWLSWMTVIVRTDETRDIGPFANDLRAAVWQQDAKLPVHQISSVPELYRQSVARRRFATVLTGAFASAALVLGMIGMYGVLSYTVVQRRREFGIRLALGARASQVTSVVVREALVLAVVAIVVGTGAAVGLTRLLDDLLYQVSPTDPVTFAGVAVVVAAVAWVAAWVPARRATRIDPATTIRDA
jgi:predicted permease